MNTSNRDGDGKPSFVVSAIGPHHRGFKAFPNGFWYGTVDGFSVTAPYGSAQAATEIAQRALDDGGYTVAIRSQIACMEHWLTQSQEFVAKANDALPDLRARLAKARAYDAARAAEARPEEAHSS